MTLFFSVNFCKTVIILIFFNYVYFYYSRAGNRSSNTTVFALPKVRKITTWGSYFYRTVENANYFSGKGINLLQNPSTVKKHLETLLCNSRLLRSHMRLKKNRPYNHWLKSQGHYLLCFSTSRTVGANSVRLRHETRTCYSLKATTKISPHSRK